MWTFLSSCSVIPYFQWGRKYSDLSLPHCENSALQVKVLHWKCYLSKSLYYIHFYPYISFNCCLLPQISKLCTVKCRSHHLISVSSNLIWPHLIFFSQVFNTSLAEPLPEGYEDVSNVVPPYSAFSAKGQPEVRPCTHRTQWCLNSFSVQQYKLLR